MVFYAKNLYFIFYMLFSVASLFFFNFSHFFRSNCFNQHTGHSWNL